MELKNPTPPKLAKWLLALSVAWKFKDEAENDLDELFQIRSKNWGESYAKRLYWQDVWSIWIRRSWFEELDFTHLNTFSMFKNYLKVTLRSLKNQKVYSAINVFGLAIGLAFCSLIFLYIQDELTYNQMHQERDRVYRVEQTFFNEDGTAKYSNRNASIPLGPQLKEEIPGIENFARIFAREHYVKTNSDPIRERVLYADEELLSIFTFPAIAGNTQSMLPNINSVVITEKIATKYFGDESALGKTLSIRKNEVFEDFEVTGVVKDMPSNSTVYFEILLHIKGDNYYTQRFMDRFDMNIYRTYVILEEQVTAENLIPALDQFSDKYHGDYIAYLKERDGWDSEFRNYGYRLNPLNDLHLNSNSDPLYSYILSAIAIGILLIACINFMTLSIGRSSRRSKEVGMRKVIGAHRSQLMTQFWGEAFLICGISLLIGVLLAEAFLPIFNALSGKTLEFNYLENWSTLSILVGFIFVTGLIAGSYPAILLSNIKPVHSLKGTLKLSGSNLFTKSLVSLQFALSVTLIVSTLVMNNQLRFIQNQDLGFDKEHVVMVPLNRLDGLELADLMRNTIGNNANIIDISATGTTMGFEGSIGYGVNYNGENIPINVFTVESNYVDFFGLEIVDGRDLNSNISSDTLEAVLVNEALVERFELTDPIGQKIPSLVEGESVHGGAFIVGIVKDHKFAALYQKISPAMFSMNPAWGHGNLMIRVQPNNISQTIAEIEESWNNIVPEVPFEYSFLDEDLFAVYEEDQKWASIVNYASGFAILIACLGLFGLVTLTVTSRKKEVGIRKVLGASVLRITTLFASDFIKLVVLGLIIAAPVAYFMMNSWLQNFAYRINVDWSHYSIAGLIVIGIALFTISFQTIRAGLSNPADTLANE